MKRSLRKRERVSLTVLGLLLIHCIISLDSNSDNAIGVNAFQIASRPPTSTIIPFQRIRVSTCRKPQAYMQLYSTPPSTEGNDKYAASSKPSYNWTKQSMQIALPALIGMLADPLLSLMDTAYVGRLGSLELAALGSCTSIFHLAFNTFRATTAATTSLVATSLEEDPDEARSVTSISLQLGLGMGMALLVSLFTCGNWVLRAMGVNPATSPLYPAASRYLFTRSWAAPAVLFIGVAEGAFRGYANTWIPLVASLTAAAINLVLDPILMFRPISWGVAGAAAATAISQFGAAAVYVYWLWKQKMLPQPRVQKTLEKKRKKSKRPAWQVIRTILGANVAMLTKQGSLLLGWAFATRRATRLGPSHVAAHQVGLSVWLMFALILDGAAVASQVLMSRAWAQRDKPAASSLVRYMIKFAILQGLVTMLIVDGVDLVVPVLFTKDKVIQGHLHKLMPHLALQQILVSLTLVVESLAVGGNQFQTLAWGTALATVASVWQISLQSSVDGIWSVGIVTLFAGRLLTACLATWRAFRSMGTEPNATVEIVAVPET